MPLITRITGDFFFTVPSLAHSLIKRAPVQLQTFDYTELAVGTSFIGLRPADSKCLPWEAGSCSLCYITVLSWSALSVHTCILLRSTSKFLLPGVPGLNCTVHHSWWYLPAQQMLAFQCTERTIQPCATRCTASLVQKMYRGSEGHRTTIVLDVSVHLQFSWNDSYLIASLQTSFI